MAEIYDSEDLKKAEEKPSNPGSFTTSTSSGGVNFTPEPVASKPPELSSSTAPGNTLYTSSPDATAPERSLYTSSSAQGSKVKFGNFVRKRKGWIFGGLGAATTGGIIAFSIFASGPFQLIHLSQILQRPFEKNDSDSSLRLGRLYRFAKTGNIGETRVGKLGSYYFGRTIEQLSNIGVEIKTNPITGSPTETTIDSEKLGSAYPEIKDMAPEAKIAWLSERLGLSSDLIKNPDGLGKTFNIDQTDFDVKTARLVTKNTVGFLDDIKIIAGLKGRVMTKFYGLPSLFHPFQRIAVNKETQILNSAQRRAAEQQDEQQREAAETGAVESEGSGLAEGVKGKTSTTGKSLIAGLSLTSGACLVRSISGDIVKINHDLVYVPAAITATDRIAAGAQVQAGQDLAASQAGTVIDGFTNSQGKSIWQGQALEALASNGAADQSLTDLPADYRQAFSPKTTAAAIQGTTTEILNYLPGGATFWCNPVTQTVSFIVGPVVSFIGDAFSGGTLTPAIVAAWAADQATQTVVTGTALHFLDNFIINKTTYKLATDAFSGPVGGDLLAYGARAAANTVAVAGGGVALANSAVSTFISADEQQFQSSSLANRLFNPSDYRSAVGRLIDDSSTSPVQNLAKIGSIFTGFGNLFSNAFSFLSPHAEAASSYNWGFPQYGLPNSLLNDPSLQNPYDNAAQVAQILDGGNASQYIQRANTCFGVDITNQNPDNVWDVIPQNDVNAADSSYTLASCNDFSDANWKRIVMFVFDTNTMKAAACYENDEQSCIDLGIGNSQSSTSNAPGSSSGTYTDPLRDVEKSGSLTPKRVDQGVDYGGAGSVYALGNGTLVNINNPGWAICSEGGCSGPNFIVYQLSDGPAAGKYVYIAENCNPDPQLKLGQQVTSNTVLCTMVNKGPFIEMGWAETCSQGFCGFAAAHTVWSGNDNDQHYTDYGQNFSDLLKSLGAPPGTIAPGAQELKAITGSWPTW